MCESREFPLADGLSNDPRCSFSARQTLIPAQDALRAPLQCAQRAHWTDLSNGHVPTCIAEACYFKIYSAL